MQNYGQQQAGYQRPGSTTGYGGPPVPPPYGAPQGYQSAAPQTQSQWAPPAPSQTPSQQWNQQSQQSQQSQQPQQVPGGYNPGVYGAMPGAYSQAQQTPTQTSTAYHPHQDVPPPPPPKPAEFAAVSQQQNVRNWGQQQQTGYGAQQPQQSQQNTGYSGQGQQGAYAPQSVYQGQVAPQQSYSNSAPPPPSQTPGGSYFPPSQTPQTGVRPGSMYGADQGGTYSTPSSAVAQHPPNSVLSPNEQHPAYIPPSLTGQGNQSYIPANTNPMPGVYVPPPPDIPAWQQASHAPLQGGKKFRYTQPTVDPSFYAQGYQGVQPVQAQGQYGQIPTQPSQQYGQDQFQGGGQAQQHGLYGQTAQNQGEGQPQQQGQYGQQAAQPQQPQQPQYGQPNQQTQYFEQTAQTPHGQVSQSQSYQQPPPPPQQQQQQQQRQQPSQWQPAPPADQGYGQQQPPPQASYGAQQQHTWHPGHEAHGSVTGQQFTQGHEPGIQAPKPIVGHTDTTAPGFVNEPNPQSQPVSPLHNRFSTSFSSGQIGVGRTGSVSSIALGAIHAQRAGNRTESPRPPPPKLPTPPPPRDDATKFSVLSTGGPSDWEHFGQGEEIDDEELFGVKKDEKKSEQARLDSVELPGHQVSPPQTQGEWPTPPSQSISTTFDKRDTYQPTPPPQTTNTPTQRPPSQPPQQGFHMGSIPSSQPSQQNFVVSDVAPTTQQPQQVFVVDDAIVAPLEVTHSPRPVQHTQPPPAQHSFAINEDSRPSSIRGTPAQQQAQHQPPPTANTSFVLNNGGWGAPQGVPTSASNQWAPQPNEAHVAELKAKDDALERLRTDLEKEKAGLHAELAQLKVVMETTKKHAEYERTALAEQVESMKVAAEQTKNTADALNKEKDCTIERLKEDAEGKEDTISEKDTVIQQLRDDVRSKEDMIRGGIAFAEDLKQQLSAKDSEIDGLKQQLDAAKTKDEEINDLKQQLEAANTKDDEINNLKQQLEAEMSKEVPKATPADLVSDIDPWYAGSLERYITMLRSEAHEPLVENKIQVFTGFLQAESEIRGLPYYKAPPSAPIDQQSASQDIHQPATLSRGASNASTKPKDLNTQVRPESPDDIQYSPGGRPIFQRGPISKSETSTLPPQASSTSSDPPSQSGTVLTPTSSQDDGFNKTSTPLQSPPESQPQPQYKAYVPPGVSQADSATSLHRQSISFIGPSVSPGTSFGAGKKDEVFFGHPSFGTSTPHSSSKPSSRPTTSASTTPDVSVPAPLFTPHPPALATKPPPKNNVEPVEKLARLLPAKVGMPQPNSQLQALRKKLSEFPSDLSSLQGLTSTWEKTASLARKKNDDARRKRQEQSEEETDRLFNEDQISYADIAVIEDEFTVKERILKAEEDRVEYKSYVETVFDKVYDGMQLQIKDLMDLYIEAESLLATAVSGVKSFEGSNVATTEACLKLLEELHEQIEQRHDKVVEAVAERDKRYKKTEIQPLYAAGNISKMKAVEKHFANAEKQAIQRARDEKAERATEFVRQAEAAVIAAVGIEQQEIESIISAIRDLSSPTDEQLLMRARETVLALGDSSKALLSLLNELEIDLGGAVLKAQLAEAEAENQLDRVSQLRNEIGQREKELKEELERKVGVLDQDREDIDRLVEEKAGEREDKGEDAGDVMGMGKMSEEELRKVRLNKALEAAKRRNGDL